MHNITLLSKQIWSKQGFSLYICVRFWSCGEPMEDTVATRKSPARGGRTKSAPAVVAQAEDRGLRIERMQRSKQGVQLIEPHLHPRHFQLMFARRGKCSMDLDRQSQHIEGPCLVCVPSGYVHGFAVAPGGEGWVITAPDSIMHMLCSEGAWRLTEPLLSAPTVLAFAADAAVVADLTWLMQHLERECNGTQRGAGLGAEALLRFLMVLVLRYINRGEVESKKADRDRTLFAQFRRLVEEHYCDHWRAREFAAALRVSQPRLNRLCERFGGSTAYEIVLNRLFLEAQRKLTYTSASATRIALSLGFQDSGYFSRFFKQRAGMPPGEFRDRKSPAPVTA